jgi:hypothetical protein
VRVLETPVWQLLLKRFLALEPDVPGSTFRELVELYDRGVRSAVGAPLLR